MLKKIFTIGFVFLNLFASMAQPWQTLFDGKTLNGWKIVGDKGKVSVENGYIRTQRTPGTIEHTFVTTKKKYDDFILEVDFKLDKPGYSNGVLVRCIDAATIANPDTANVRLYGYQIKIDERVNRKWTGGIFDDFGKTYTWLYDVSENPAGQEAFKFDEWNTFRIEAIGNNIKVWTNGVPTCNLVNNKYTKGYIALKVHAMKAQAKGGELTICFKNIRIITKNPKTYAKEMTLKQIVKN